MSYKIMEGGFCVEKDIDTVALAQKKAGAYCSDADVDLVTIEDESTGETVMTGHATLVMEWTDAS